MAAILKVASDNRAAEQAEDVESLILDLTVWRAVAERVLSTCDGPDEDALVLSQTLRQGLDMVDQLDRAYNGHQEGD